MRSGRNLQARPAIFVRLGCLLFILNAARAEAAQVGNAQQGLKLAREACAQCHVIGKSTRRSMDTTAPSFSTIANTPGMTSAALAAAFQTSHKTMPNVVIKEDDANNLIAYILNLKNHL